jgi:hypothetical protein
MPKMKNTVRYYGRNPAVRTLRFALSAGTDQTKDKEDGNWETAFP